jgi:hypothetical protein
MTAAVAMSSTNEDENEWWRNLLAELTPSVSVNHVSSLSQLHRKANRQLFHDKMDQKTFFLISCLSWMDSCRWFDGIEPNSLDQILSHSSNISMVTWMLPSVAKSSSSTVSMDNRQEWLNMWLSYFDTCNETEQSRPAKRRKRTFGFTQTVLKGKYKLPSAYLMVSLLHRQATSSRDQQITWESLHSLVHKSLSQYFKTFTYDDIQAALCLFGLDCIHSRMPMEGLTPVMLLGTYLSRTGYVYNVHVVTTLWCSSSFSNNLSCLVALCVMHRESILAVFQQQHEDLSSFALRACICDHLLEPVYMPPADQELDDSMILTTIRVSASFLHKESAKRYLQNFRSANSSNGKKRISSSNAIPSRIASPGYPVLTQIGLYLLQDNLWNAAELVRQLESTEHVDEVTKDEGWLTIFQYLFNTGQLFLDRNFALTKEYSQKRDLLYNTVVSQMGELGRESMIHFYLTVHEQVASSPMATFDEMKYVEVACQQTLLRLLFKTCGLGSATVSYFLEKTSHKWPNLTPFGDLEQWAASFLQPIVNIPKSLQQEDDGFEGTVHLGRFMTVLKDKEEEEVLLIDNSEPAEQEQVVLYDETARQELVPPVPEDEDKLRSEKQQEGEEQPLDPQESGEEDKEVVELVDSSDDEEVPTVDSSDTDYGQAVEEQDSQDGSEFVEESDEERMSDTAINKVAAYDYEGAADYFNYEAAIGNKDSIDSDDAEEEEQYEEKLAVNENNGQGTDVEGDNEDDRIMLLDDSSVDAAVDEQANEKDENDDDEEQIDDKEDNEYEDVDERVMVVASSSQHQDDSISELWQLPVYDEEAGSPVNEETRGFFEDVKQLETVEIDDQDDEKIRAEAAAAIAPLSGPAASTLEGQADKGSPAAAENEVMPKNEVHTGANDGTSKQVASPDSQKGDAQNSVVELLERSPEMEVSGGHEENYVETMSIEGKASKDVDSDETEDLEKEERENPVAGADFGDTTEEEDAEGTGKANQAAAEIRRSDVLGASAGYASQLEEGYEPEDTHGYTEEEVSEAIHTEDEEEDRRKKEEAPRAIVDEGLSHIDQVKPVEHSIPHSSDDMDAADEHTEPEEDLGAESSELEETTEGPPPVQEIAGYSPASSTQHEGASNTTLWQYAQTAQRQHDTLVMQELHDEKAKSVGFEQGTKMGKADKSSEAPQDEDTDEHGADAGTESNTVYTSENATKDSEDDASEGRAADEATAPMDEERDHLEVMDLDAAEYNPGEEAVAVEAKEQEYNDMDPSEVQQERPLQPAKPAEEQKIEITEPDASERAVNREQDEMKNNEHSLMETDAATPFVDKSTDSNATGDVKTNTNKDEEESSWENKTTQTRPEGNNNAPIDDDKEEVTEPAVEDATMDAAAPEKDAAKVDTPEGEGDNDTSMKETMNSKGDDDENVPNEESTAIDGQTEMQPEEIGQDDEKQEEAAVDTTVPEGEVNEEEHQEAQGGEGKDEVTEKAKKERILREMARLGGFFNPDADDVLENPGAATTRSTRRSTRARGPTEQEDDEQSASSGPTRSARSSGSRKRGGDDKSVQSTGRRSTRLGTHANAKKSDDEDDEPVASTASQPKRSTRASKQKRSVEEENEDDRSAIVRDTLPQTKASDKIVEEEETEEPQTTRFSARTTRGRKKQDGDEESFASAASRSSRRSTRSTRSTGSQNKKDKEKVDDDQSLASTASRASNRSTRSKMNQDDDGDSVASAASRSLRRSTRAKRGTVDETDDDEDDKSVASTTSPRGRSTRAAAKVASSPIPSKRPRAQTEGKPPLAPTRTSKRTRAKRT